MAKSPEPPLVAHVIHRLDVGGMENGLVNLINRIPQERYRHAVVCLTEHAEFRDRIRRENVPLFALHKREGNDLRLHFRLWRVLRDLKPTLVHTRNLAAIEGVLSAALAGAPYRVHGEHGRDVQDMDGTSLKYRLLRQALSPFVHRFIPLSNELETYLENRVGISPRKITRICNGVDTDKFRPARGGRSPLPLKGFAEPDSVVIGTVGRMKEVKNPLLLARAFIRLGELLPEHEHRMRLVMVGDGPLKSQIEEIVKSSGIESVVWLPGSRDDIPELLRGMDVFVLPSLVEGISNTILESMASGIPVVATEVGGNSELVDDGVTGALVPPDDLESMARAIADYVRDADCRRSQGRAGRLKTERDFSMERMVEAYLGVYDEVLYKFKPGQKEPSSRSIRCVA